MPLPDERPRQSVANLIGKFETQTKRLSLSASSPSRSSSVVSHITGDSVKEEVKERREWPPKSTTESAQKQSPIVPPLYSRYPPPPLISSSLSNPPADAAFNKKSNASGAEIADADVPLTAKALNASQSGAQVEPNAFLENWRKDLPSPSEQGAMVSPSASDTAKPEPNVPESNAATPTLANNRKLKAPSTPRASTATSKTAAAVRSPAPPKAATSAVPRTPAKSVLKSPSSRTSLAPAATQPLKPQHTGQSGASSATAKRPVSKPTPASAKAPARAEATSTPRAKTPSSSRPKTPSTGLFAPTAASLAKSRSAAPPVPTPAKKTHLSSNSIDRLSKPTAASQARMAAAAANPSRSTPAVNSSRSTPAAPRTPAAKLKAAPASKPRKEAATVTHTPNAAAVASSVAAVGLAVVAAEEQISVAEEAKAEETDEAAGHSSPSEAAEPELEVEALKGASEEIETTAHAEAQHDDSAQNSDLDAAPPSSSADDADQGEQASEAEVGADEATSALLVEAKSGDDLEAIVNLLETVTITKPHDDTTANIPDELMEIPDEEEK